MVSILIPFFYSKLQSPLKIYLNVEFSTALPVFDMRNDFGSSSVNRDNTANCTGSTHDVNGFDSLLSDINSALPPVSHDTKKVDTGAYSSCSVSLLQPPSQDISAGAKGTRY